MPIDPKHIQRLESAPYVKRKFPIDVDPIRWATHVAMERDTPQPPIMPPHGKIYARINWSRWIVDCPFCTGAQDASLNHPVFWCTDCAMDGNGGAPMTVVFPPNYEQIERVLLQRADPRNRNWTPSEKLKDIIEENRAHGDSVPPGVE